MVVEVDVIISYLKVLLVKLSIIFNTKIIYGLISLLIFFFYKYFIFVKIIYKTFYIMFLNYLLFIIYVWFIKIL